MRGGAVSGLVGRAADLPFLFPSLGPTLMVLSETPDKPSARPRNVVIGHAVGVAAGWIALAVTGLLDHPPSLDEGISLPRILAAALALGLTAFTLQAVRAPHPPAGATTLIVALGLLHTGRQLVTIMLAVVLCTSVTIAIRELLHRPLRIDPAGDADSAGTRPG